MPQPAHSDTQRVRRDPNDRMALGANRSGTATCQGSSLCLSSMYQAPQVRQPSRRMFQICVQQLRERANFASSQESLTLAPADRSHLLEHLFCALHHTCYNRPRTQRHILRKNSGIGLWNSHETRFEPSCHRRVSQNQCDAACRDIHWRYKARLRLSNVAIIILSSFIEPTITFKHVLNVALNLVGRMQGSQLYDVLVICCTNNLITKDLIVRDDHLN